jgi:hypothetical protein
MPGPRDRPNDSDCREGTPPATRGQIAGYPFPLLGAGLGPSSSTFTILTSDLDGSIAN